jgi:hypothetical protein
VQWKLKLHWSPGPGANDDIIQKNKANTAAFKAREKAGFERAMIETVKERVELASIKTRTGDELHEEERPSTAGSSRRCCRMASSAGRQDSSLRSWWHRARKAQNAAPN